MDESIVCSRCGAAWIVSDGEMRPSCECCIICNSYNRLHSKGCIPYPGITSQEWQDNEAWEYLSDEALTGFEDAINDEPRQEVVEMIERSSRDNAAIWRELAKE